MGKRRKTRRTPARRIDESVNEQLAELIVPLSMLVLATRHQLRAMRSKLTGNA